MQVESRSQANVALDQHPHHSSQQADDDPADASICLGPPHKALKLGLEFNLAVLKSSNVLLAPCHVGMKP